MSASIASIFRIWRPFFRLEVWIQEMGCIVVRAKNELGKEKNYSASSHRYLLAKYRGLERHGIDWSNAISWFQFI